MKHSYQGDSIDPLSRLSTEDLSRFPSENPNPVLRIDSSGMLIYANNASRILLDEWKLEFDQPAPLLLREAALSSLSEARSMEIDVPHKTRVYAFSIAPIVESGYANLYGRDITKRVRTEESIRQALLERETLIRELYHRTKNNMNIISSMISLSASYSEDENLMRLSQEIENKITSMSLVHQMLYESKNLSSIDLDGYIQKLARLLLKSYQNGGNTIVMSFDLVHIAVPIDLAIPCGLVLNELFTNSLKHAFPKGEKGTIAISLSFLEAENEIELMYADDGIGLPHNYDVRSQSTLGMQTIFLIIEHQLGGTIAFDKRGERGLRCSIRFKRIIHPTLEDLR
jgi:two-component sensor histidine kinase